MKRCKIQLHVTLELDAFTIDDAVDLATELVYDLDGLGVTVAGVTVTGKTENGD